MGKEENQLEKKIIEGIYGPPEIKKEEKNRFLGEYKERVIRYLTLDQVQEPGVYPEIIKAMNSAEAKKLIIDRNVDIESAHDYIKLAREENLVFKRVDSPEFKGDVALIVASDRAVNTENRKVLPRMERLQAKGISDKIIKNVGAKLCDKCWLELKEKAPEELVNYEKMGFFDKLFGHNCLCEK